MVTAPPSLGAGSTSTTSLATTENVMNAKDRAQLNKLYSDLEGIKSEIETMADAEQEKYDNMSENLQGGERGEKMQAGAEALAEAVSSIEEALNSIETAKEE